MPLFTLSCKSSRERLNSSFLALASLDASLSCVNHDTRPAIAPTTRKTPPEDREAKAPASPVVAPVATSEVLVRDTREVISVPIRLPIPLIMDRPSIAPLKSSTAPTTPANTEISGSNTGLRKPNTLTSDLTTGVAPRITLMITLNVLFTAPLMLSRFWAILFPVTALLILSNSAMTFAIPFATAFTMLPNEVLIPSEFFFAISAKPFVPLLSSISRLLKSVNVIFPSCKAE